MHPFIDKKYKYACKLLQDNDAKHSIKLCSKTIKQLNIKWVKSPPLSPDLNPIESVWGDLKHFIRRKFCNNVQELKKAVAEFKNKVMTPEYCQAYIKRLLSHSNCYYE